MSKIQADEISSIIKERIDGFELNNDILEHNRPQICMIECDDYEYLRLQSAVEAAIASESPIEVICTTQQQMREVLNEQGYWTNNKFDHLEVLADREFKKENHQHGWYRKFEKKRF